MKFHKFILFTFLFCLSISVTQAQPEFSSNELNLIKKNGYSDAVKYRLPQDKFPMPENNQDRPLLADGSLDSTYNPTVTDGFGYVNKTLVQPDGKIIVVGLFQRTNGVRTYGIARVNADGSSDTSFSNGTGANAAVLAAALQPDGKIIVGGAFTSFNGQTVNRIARLNSDGSIDSSFSTNVAFNAQINDILVLSDGKLLVGGEFNVASASRLVRLNSNGTLDSLSVSFSSTVYTIAQAPNGKILIGGQFSQPRQTIARLNADGTLDSSFSSFASSSEYPIFKIVVQPNGKILAAGGFSTFNGIAADGLVRLNENGTLDRVFEITSNPEMQFFSVNALALQPDGKILAGFRDDSSDRSADVRRFNADGSTDATFNTNTNNSLTVTDLNLLADGSILTAGYFATINNQQHLRLLKLNSNGSLDNTFNPAFSSLGTIYAIKRQANGKTLIGGDFAYVNGVAKNAVARLNADGTLDNTFTLGDGLVGEIYAIEVQPDGKIIIGGIFNGNDNFPYFTVARLNPNGSFDVSLNPDINPAVIAYAVVLQSDGKIVIGGQILGRSNGNIAAIRVDSNGSADGSFVAPTLPNGTVRALVIQPSGKIVIGGSFFIQQGSIIRNGIARLNTDGSFDSAFTGGAATYSLKPQPDGSVYAGGFTLRKYSSEGVVDQNLNIGSGFNGLIRAIEVQPDGKILIGGAFTTYKGSAVNQLIRIGSNGALDSGFTAQPAGTVFALHLQPDGKILVGGQFLDFNGTEKLSLVRLQGMATAISHPLFDFDGDGRSDVSVFRPANGAWYLQQSTAGFAGIQFGQSGDSITPADFDGDGKTDLAVFRAGVWYLNRSSQGFAGIQFGSPGDIPLPADYDGDGKADLAVFRPSTGAWYLQQSTNGFAGVQFGQSGDKPVAADYDGDGKADIAVYRAGVWYLNRSTAGFTGIQFGNASDLVVPADYDGDGKADVAVFRPSEGTWYLNRSSAGFTGVQFGQNGDAPASADYDGDGKADLGVFRNGTWYLQRSTAGFTGVSFGSTGDKPVPNAFVQ